nr:polysaccharide deacetylase family protein [Conexibacter arvalis]
MTFDDDWAGHAAVALPLLRAAGMRATFFLSGATLERPFDFWYERLQQAVDAGIAVPPHVPSTARERIHALAAEVERLPAAERDALVAAIAERLGPPPAEGLPAAAVAALVADGHEIGFHTRRHDTLPFLDDDGLAAALRDGREALAAAVGRPVDTIAYPSGKADARVVAAAADAGFREAWTTMPTAVGPDSPPLWLGRVYPPQEERGRLALVLARALLDARGASATPPAPTAQLTTAA